MAGFSREEIDKRLGDLPGWSFEDGQLTKVFKFDSFTGSIDFVNRVAEAAEQHDHHPDIDIRYAEVTISVSSHDIGGISERDINLASESNRIAG